MTPFGGDVEQFEKVERKHDVFSLEGLIAWLENQPAETTYDPQDGVCHAQDCLLGRYSVSIKKNFVIPDDFKIVAYRGLLAPQTYASALERARHILNQRAQSL